MTVHFATESYHAACFSGPRQTCFPASEVTFRAILSNQRSVFRQIATAWFFLVAKISQLFFVAILENKSQVFVPLFTVEPISFPVTYPIGQLGTVQPCLLNFVRHFKEAQLL